MMIRRFNESLSYDAIKISQDDYIKSFEKGLDMRITHVHALFEFLSRKTKIDRISYYYEKPVKSKISQKFRDMCWRVTGTRRPYFFVFFS